MGESGPKRKKNVSVRGREGQSYNSKWDGITWDQKVGAIIPGPAPGVCHVVGVATPDPGEPLTLRCFLALQEEAGTRAEN